MLDKTVLKEAEETVCHPVEGSAREVKPNIVVVNLACDGTFVVFQYIDDRLIVIGERQDADDHVTIFVSKTDTGKTVHRDAEAQLFSGTKVRPTTNWLLTGGKETVPLVPGKMLTVDDNGNVKYRDDDVDIEHEMWIRTKAVSGVTFYAQNLANIYKQGDIPWDDKAGEDWIGQDRASDMIKALAMPSRAMMFNALALNGDRFRGKTDATEAALAAMDSMNISDKIKSGIINQLGMPNFMEK